MAESVLEAQAGCFAFVALAALEAPFRIVIKGVEVSGSSARSGTHYYKIMKAVIAMEASPPSSKTVYL